MLPKNEWNLQYFIIKTIHSIQSRVYVFHCATNLAIKTIAKDGLASVKNKKQNS